MQDYIKEGRSFDYVFGDLTDVPISPTPRGELWDFMRTVMGSGTKLIKPSTGKYMTHVRGSNAIFVFGKVGRPKLMQRKKNELSTCHSHKTLKDAKMSISYSEKDDSLLFL